jgi:hypothetical protein
MIMDRKPAVTRPPVAVDNFVGSLAQGGTQPRWEGAT